MLEAEFFLGFVPCQQGQNDFCLKICTERAPLVERVRRITRVYCLFGEGDAAGEKTESEAAKARRGVAPICQPVVGDQRRTQRLCLSD